MIGFIIGGLILWWVGSQIRKEYVTSLESSDSVLSPAIFDLIDQLEKDLELGLKFDRQQIARITSNSGPFALAFQGNNLLVTSKDAKRSFPQLRVSRPNQGSPHFPPWSLILTGDKHFDGLFDVRAPSNKWLSLLKPRYKKTLCQMLDFELHEETYTFHWIFTTEQVKAALAFCGEMLGADPLTRALNYLEDETVDDPDYYLSMLVEHFQGLEETHETALRFLNHPIWRTRRLAILLLGKEGLPHLRKLLENEMFRRDSIQAIGAIQAEEATLLLMEIFEAHVLTGEETQILLKGLLKRNHAELVKAHFVETLIAAMEKHDTVAFHELATDFLSKTKVPQATAYLLSMLEHHQAPLWDNAVTALDRCGDINAVAPIQRMMKECSEQEHLPLLGALTAIQMRLGDVEAGWLTLAEVNSSQGALSLVADQDEGKISLTNQKEGNDGE